MYTVLAYRLYTHHTTIQTIDTPFPPAIQPTRHFQHGLPFICAVAFDHSHCRTPTAAAKRNTDIWVHMVYRGSGQGRSGSPVYQAWKNSVSA